MNACRLFALAVCLWPCIGRGAGLNLATFTCAQFESQILNSASPPAGSDAVNVVMWLFGFSVARSGAHAMYGNALPAYGNGLDQQCKDHPQWSLLEATAAVELRRADAMDLVELNCADFEKRDAQMRLTDKDSADTIMMWLFGFAVGKSGQHALETDALPNFRDALAAECTRRPADSLFDTLTAVRTPATAPPPDRDSR